MVTSRYKDRLSRALDPLGAAVARLNISPTSITLAGPILGSLVALVFVRTRQVLPSCGAIALVGCLDALDGAVARASGRVTKFGAYLDAVCDRYFETIGVLAAAYVTGYWVLSLIVITGALLVSYAKARAAMEVAVSNLEWPDLMERTERDVLFLIGLVASALVDWRPLGRDLFWWTLLVLAVLIHGTVLQRILRARGYILRRGGR